MNNPKKVVVYMKVADIKPDPNQPNQTINQERVSQLAAAIKSQGLINPIEVDSNGMIVTGEHRWRAVSELGWEEIPCTIIDPKDWKERLLRQLIENVSHGNMTDYDLAYSMSLLISGASSRGELAINRDSFHSSPYFQKGITWLSEEIGKSKGWIHEKLTILSEGLGIQEAVKEGKLSARAIREVNSSAPEEFRADIKQGLIQGKIPSIQAAQKIGAAIRKAPEKADDLLEMDFSGRSTAEVIQVVKEIAPTDADLASEALEEAFSSGDEILRTGDAFQKALRNNPPDTISGPNKIQVAMLFASMIKNMQKYLQVVAHESNLELSE